MPTHWSTTIEVPVLCFYSAKGGTGCSVAAAATALLLARDAPTLLVDLTGDQPAILGLPASDSHDPPGLDSWLTADSPPPDGLRWCEQFVVERLGLVATSVGSCAPTAERQELLASVLRSEERTVVVDVGDNEHLRPIVERASRSVLVTTDCYVALSRARRWSPPDDIVLVSEPHRALTAADVQAVLGSPVAAVIRREAPVFRAVDAGLLTSRLPRSLRRLEVFR